MGNISIRNIEPEVIERFNRSAKARGLSQAEYLERLIDLHDACRRWESMYGSEVDDMTINSGAFLFGEMEKLGMVSVSV